MIIEDETKTTMCTIVVDFKFDPIITQRYNTIIIDKHQAMQLVEALQRWIDGEEIE